MFDLFRSRDKAVRYLLGALLGLVALSLVITLIPGYGASTGGREQVVADIGGEPLTVREVQTTLQMALRNRQVPQEMLQFYLPQVVDQMITERAVAYQAKRMGFQITDQEVGNAIRSMLMQYFPNGDIPETAYRQFLQQQGQDVERFERNVRMNLLMLRLQNLALEGAIVTPDEVEKEFHRKNDKIKVQYVKFTAPVAASLRSGITVSPEEIRSYYTKNKAAFTIPEKHSVNVLVADEAKIGAAFQVPEQELRAAYASQADRFRTGERVHARHILIKGDKGEAKANELLKQLKGGADFADLAKKNSEDPGSAANGGDLGFFGKGQMVAPFENLAFAQKPKDIGVVKSDFGWHVIQTLEKEPAKVKTFEEVKEQLATERRREAVQARMQQVIDQARAELAKNPNAAQEIASRLNLAYAHGEKVGGTDSIGELGAVPELEAAVAGAKAGTVSQVFQMGQNRLAVAAVTQVFPAHPAELAEVEEQVRERILGEKTAQLVDQKVKEATEKMRAAVASGDLAAVAKQVGSTVKDADYVAIDAAAEGIGPASFLAEGFTKPEGAIIGPFNVSGDVFVAKTTGKQIADASQLAKQRDELVLDLKRKRALQRKELFEDSLMTQLIKEGKVKKYSEIINRILASYRT